jgi:hypothetical protein
MKLWLMPQANSPSAEKGLCFRKKKQPPIYQLYKYVGIYKKLPRGNTCSNHKISAQRRERTNISSYDCIRGHLRARCACNLLQLEHIQPAASRVAQPHSWS